MVDVMVGRPDDEAFAGLPERIAGTLFSDIDGRGFCISDRSATNAVEIMREWLRARGFCVRRVDGEQAVKERP